MSTNIAVLVEKNFHDLEFWYPYLRLVEEDLDPVVVAPVGTKSLHREIWNPDRSQLHSCHSGNGEHFRSCDPWGMGS